MIAITRAREAVESARALPDARAWPCASTKGSIASWAAWFAGPTLAFTICAAPAVSPRSAVERASATAAR